ncbi:aldehyde dehydrogenase family protein [Duganella sp. FT92W]|uniref:Aldehyde dehydrogenase family protein n=1 Tax=Pseudoduganella rivuli TaxID=2666085 RepID=A0A7X2LUA6_9BURK|nr:NAD-dependent succinate-semialdehyde dehydrogenase [Pseudoduganella rivuli]MRV73758.1 aldehyde dehydrogenase family protein [Pseudoduganella rivuli]
MSYQEIIETPKGLYIDGQWCDASDGATFSVTDPATGDVLADVASASVDDALAAVAAADAAGKAWAATPPRRRSDILRQAFALLVARAESFARLIVLESGKALAEARGEVAYAAEFLRWYAEEAVRIVGEVSTAPGGANRILVVRQPIGVAVFVTPWNFPAAMVTRKIGPALAAGCTVVLKPASETPLTALAMAALFEEAGVPAGVVNVVPSRQSGQVVGAMLHDPRVRKLSFTGSTGIGRVLLAQAAGNVVKCSMELGGNAPFIVFADADLDAAVAAAMVAKLRNGGESCTAANRFYVERPVAEEFSRRFAAAMAAVNVGPGLDDGVQLGPLINGAALDKVAQLVDEAVAQGATVLTGGRARAGRGYFYEPTLLAGVAPDARILREEIFGPVAPVCVFDTVDEAVALANDTEYGLVAFVHTRDLAKALAVSERIEAGMVGINRGVVSDPAAPFGGWKQSGVGREGGHDGLLEYLESKYICVAW